MRFVFGGLVSTGNYEGEPLVVGEVFEEVGELLIYLAMREISRGTGNHL